MNTMCLLTLLVFNINQLDTVFAAEWICPVIQEIIALDPYHVTIVTNEMRTTGILKNIKEISQIIPTVSVNLKEMKKLVKNTSLTHAAFHRSSETIFYLIFYDIKVNNDDNYLEELRYFFHHLRKFTPGMMSPKCLIVTTSETLIPEKSFQPILRYAWEMKFLDVTVVRVTESEDKNEPIQYSYNPFFKAFDSKTVHLKSTLFPNKLRNMNGHSITMPLYNLPPYIAISKSSNGLITEIDGVYYMFTTILSKVLNFSIVNLPETDMENESGLVARLTKMLANHTVNMLPIPMFMSSYMRNNQHFETSVIFRRMKFVAFIPILKRDRMILPDSLFDHFVVGILFLIVIRIIARLLRFNKEYWNFVNVVRVFLGHGMPYYAPLKPLERVLLVCTFLLSITYLNGIFLELIDVKMITESQDYKSLKEIADSNLDIFMEQYVFHRLFPPSNPFNKKIKSKLVNFTNIFECIDELRRTRKHMCLDSKPHAKLLMNSYNKLDSTPIMKIAEYEMPFDSERYIYEEGFPYARRFDEILIRSIESGIWKNWAYSRKWAVHLNLNSINAQDRGSISIIQLVTILFVGYTISFVVFSIEFLRLYMFKYFDSKRSNKHTERRYR